MGDNWRVDLDRRYRYLGDRLTRPDLRGACCYALVRPDGRCIRGNLGTMAVQFESGERSNVIGRLLRKEARP